MDGDNPLPFLSPCTICVNGGASSGKTTLVSKILENVEWCFKDPTRSIFYFAYHRQRFYDTTKTKISNLKFHYCMSSDNLLEPLYDPTQHDYHCDHVQIMSLSSHYFYVPHITIISILF